MDLIATLTVAILVAASVAVLAGLAVLIGALAAAAGKIQVSESGNDDGAAGGQCDVGPDAVDGHADHLGAAADRLSAGIFEASPIALKDDRIGDGASLKPAEITSDAEAAHVAGADVDDAVRDVEIRGADHPLIVGDPGAQHHGTIGGIRRELAEQVVSVGDELFVKVIDIDLERRRISLSLKQANEGVDADSTEFDPALYGMAAEYDEEGNYKYPEGFDPESNEWLEGYENQRAAWEQQYADAQTRWEAHKKQVAEAEKAASAVARAVSATTAVALRTLLESDLPQRKLRDYLLRIFERTTEDDFDTLRELGLLEQVDPSLGAHTPATLAPEAREQLAHLLAALAGQPKEPFRVCGPEGPAEEALSRLGAGDGKRSWWRKNGRS